MAQVTIDFFELLKKGGNLLQYRLNNSIKKNLNQFSLIDFTGSKTNPLVKRMNHIQKFTEQMTNYMNLPTKTDIANTTQLIIQSEEKIDQLDDQLYDVSIMLNEIKQILLTQNSGITESNSLPVRIAEQEEIIRTLQEELNQAKELIFQQKKHTLSTNTASDQAM